MIKYFEHPNKRTGTYKIYIFEILDIVVDQVRAVLVLKKKRKKIIERKYFKKYIITG